MPVVVLMGGFAAFGKMPSLGDFFRLNAPTEVVTPWDGWLQQMLSTARGTLGLTFDSRYMSAPVWRFALAPSVAGAQGVVGVLMPSVDRVGRQYPLTLFAQTGGREQAPLRTLIWQQATLAALENLALDCLDDAMTREILAERLAGIALAPMGQAAEIGSFGTSLVLTGGNGPALPADLALDLAGGQLHRACVWSAEVEGAARLILTSGLPQPDVAHFLFDLAALAQKEVRA